MKQVGNGPYWIYINKISSVQYSTVKPIIKYKAKKREPKKLSAKVGEK